MKKHTASKVLLCSFYVKSWRKFCANIPKTDRASSMRAADSDEYLLLTGLEWPPEVSGKKMTCLNTRVNRSYEI